MEKQATSLKQITPQYDPWEAYMDIEDHGVFCNRKVQSVATFYT